jgi:hypothetical protein
MDQKEQDLWKMVDVGGFAAFGTLFAFTLDAIKSKVENDKTDTHEQQETIGKAYDNISKRFQDMNLNLLDKKIFPVDALRELREKLFPEMGMKYKELDTLLKHYIAGATHLKVRIVHKIQECRGIIKQMNELGQKFSKNDRYWEYRKTKPERIYLDSTNKSAK